MQGGEGDMKGIIPRMNDAVFQKISDDIARNPSMQFLVTASYFELYNEVIYVSRITCQIWFDMRIDWD